MDTADLLPLLEQLEENVDDLEEVLEPVLGRSLATISKKLPVMDKAKILVLITYTLESLIFSYLRLHGVDAKQHPVFRELTRVKQYFEKIKALETEPEQRTMTLDKGAAARFIKHGLAGNDKIDLERAEKEAKERAQAQFKAARIAKKQAAEQQGASTSVDNPSSAVPSTAQTSADSDDEDEDADEDMDEDMEDQEKAKQAAEMERQNIKKKQAKEAKANSSSKDAKLAKKERKAARAKSKKERRQKKEAARKARETQ